VGEALTSHRFPAIVWFAGPQIGSSWLQNTTCKQPLN